MSIQLVNVWGVAFIIIAMTIVMAGTLIVPRIKQLHELRRISGVESIPEIVHSAAERGRPVLFYVAWLTPDSPWCTPFVPGVMAMVRQAAIECGKTGVSMFGYAVYEKAYLLMKDYIRRGYIESGHAELYDDSKQYYGATSEMAVTSVLVDNNIGGYFGVGHHQMASGVIFIDQASRIGAVQVGGAMWPGDACYCAIGSDYFIFPDEMVAANAYLSTDPETRGNLVASDFVKMFAIALTVAALLKTLVVR